MVSSSPFIPNAAERRFARELDERNVLWFHQPKRFLLPKPFRSYKPDFYCVQDRTFYEIVGTRQAWDQAQSKYLAFRETYPNLRLKIVNGGAWSCGSKLIPNPTGKVKSVPLTVFENMLLECKSDIAASLSRAVSTLHVSTATDLAGRIGIMPSALRSIVRSGRIHVGTRKLVRRWLIKNGFLEEPAVPREENYCTTCGRPFEELHP